MVCKYKSCSLPFQAMIASWFGSTMRTPFLKGILPLSAWQAIVSASDRRVIALMVSLVNMFTTETRKVVSRNQATNQTRQVREVMANQTTITTILIAQEQRGILEI